jgi:hypothetical protein
MVLVISFRLHISKIERRNPEKLGEILNLQPTNIHLKMLRLNAPAGTPCNGINHKLDYDLFFR